MHRNRWTDRTSQRERVNERGRTCGPVRLRGMKNTRLKQCLMRGGGAVLLCALLLTGVPAAEAGHTGFHARTGRLLAADKAIGDPRFAESVILLLQHNQAGSIGLVLNNRAALPLEGVPPEMVPGLQHIYFGGPVEPLFLSVLFFGEQPPQPSKKILKTVHLTGIGEILGLLERGQAVQFRVFLGYASWAPGQLEMELAHGVWQVFPADERIFSEENVEQLWRQLQESGPVISL